jgi:hypothetical protein
VKGRGDEDPAAHLLSAALDQALDWADMTEASDAMLVRVAQLLVDHAAGAT